MFSAEGVASFLRLSREQYVDVALLLGCDYTEHVNQVRHSPHRRQIFETEVERRRFCDRRIGVPWLY